MRLVQTSVGWAEFELWGGPAGSVGIYGEDGWLPFMRSRKPLFESTEASAIDALIAQGLPQNEAEEIGRRVIRERLARIAASV
jgi:hypothetical protein